MLLPHPRGIGFDQRFFHSKGFAAENRHCGAYNRVRRHVNGLPPSFTEFGAAVLNASEKSSLILWVWLGTSRMLILA